MVVFMFLGCEVSSDVNVSSQKFNVKLFVPEADAMTELWLRLENVRIMLNVGCYIFLPLKTIHSQICPFFDFHRINLKLFFWTDQCFGLLSPVM